MILDGILEAKAPSGEHREVRNGIASKGELIYGITSVQEIQLSIDTKCSFRWKVVLPDTPRTHM